MVLFEEKFSATEKYTFLTENRTGSINAAGAVFIILST